MSLHPYRLVILGRDEAWADAVQERMERALTDVVQLPGAVEFARDVAAAGDPAGRRPHIVVAFLADESSRDDPACTAALETAREQLLAVLPLTHSGGGIMEILPPVVRPLNAMPWDADEDAAIRAILRLMGLIEEDRRLFLSYRRQETSALALQLRERLGERGYDVFLDRFSVPPAADFQRRINVELSDKAFVLLLESPAAVGSTWVQHEVAFALSHGIALLALSLPETRHEDQFPEVDEAFRRRLEERDLTGDERVLRDGTLAAVLDEIEVRHARQLRLRRVGMLGSVEHWLRVAGVACDATQDEWGLAADWPDTRGTVFLVTPRAPSPRDLRRLDDLREQREMASGRSVEGCLVHASAAQDADDEALLRWIVDRRPLQTRLHERVPDLLGIA